jgi:CubicO group peptidase (beta-lactamase class C family)
MCWKNPGMECAGMELTEMQKSEGACIPLGRQSFKGNDSAYWSSPTNSLFKKIGAKSMLMALDSVGTFQGGAIVFATARDYARFGQLYLQVRFCKP